MTIKPWREIAEPRDDVCSGNFQQAEFAADISAVHQGRAGNEYQDPELFFQMTYITEGMKQLIETVLRRISGTGGDPIIQLKTAFGGGKTHSLLSIYHIARQTKPLSTLNGLTPILTSLNICDPPKAQIVVIDGTNLNAREPKHYPEDVAQAAILFHVAGEKWTVPSVGWENTSLSLFAGDWEACANNVKRIYGAVDRLRPKMVVGTECGHAHRATVVEGPYWAGREDGKPPVPFLHYVEWLADALRKGKIKIDPAKRLKMPVTLQDSCNYIRNHGLAEHTRYIMSQIAEDFREMKCNREDNFCCGGGGGFNGIGKFRPQRDKGLYMKLQQIRETGAKMVISPCHNCWDAIRDMMEVYHVHDIKWSFLKPIIIDMMIVPDHLKPQDDE